MSFEIYTCTQGKLIVLEVIGCYGWLVKKKYSEKISKKEWVQLMQMAKNQNTLN